MQNKIPHRIKEILCALICAAMIFPIFALFSIKTSALPALPSTKDAASVYLWNCEYDELILNSSAQEKIYPASTVKLMTGLVAIELIKDKLDQRIIITEDMLSAKNGTSIPLKAGDNVSFRDLLYGAVCGGFNDAASVLAAASAGSISAFVEKMNEKAKELGARDTVYTNPTGWHDEAMVTTLSDTAKIAKAAMKNELYVSASSAPSYTLSTDGGTKEFTVNNRNGLISSYYAQGYYNRRAKGLIAGMTDEGGYCVATLAEYGGLSYLCIVMGGKEINGTISSYAIANSLISYCISYYGEIDAIKVGDVVARVPIENAIVQGEKDGYLLKCTVTETARVLAPYEGLTPDGAEIEFKPYFFSDTLSAPIEKGQTVGGVDIFVDGIYRGNAPLCSAETIEANTLLIGINKAKSFLTGRSFIIFILTFLIMLGIYFYNTELKQLRRKHKNIKIDKLY